jgi:hypothetical protein
VGTQTINKDALHVQQPH